MFNCITIKGKLHSNFAEGFSRILNFKNGAGFLSWPFFLLRIIQLIFIIVPTKQNNVTGNDLVLYIKNMVSKRCIQSVKDTFDKMDLSYSHVSLGEAEILSVVSANKMDLLKKNLLISGFEIIADKKQILIEKIKGIILEMLQNEEGLPQTNISYYIAGKLNYDYTYLANIFSEVRGITIERYIITNKIERVKELIQDGELNLTDISYKMNYSSVAHLSGQFKKITGITPTEFKKQKYKMRINLEDL